MVWVWTTVGLVCRVVESAMVCELGDMTVHCLHKTTFHKHISVPADITISHMSTRTLYSPALGSVSILYGAYGVWSSRFSCGSKVLAQIRCVHIDFEL